MIRNYDNWRSLNESKIHQDQRTLLDLGLLDLTEEQGKFLDEYTIGTWSVDLETNVVDIDGDFDCWNSGLTDFKGIRFGKVRGKFNCSDNKLTSLQGAPERVGWFFDCSENKLTSLEGAPEQVNGPFFCNGNKLTSLLGAPKQVGGDFLCVDNELTSLEGAPKEVSGSFFCFDNFLTVKDKKYLKGRVVGAIYFTPQNTRIK